jgi:hypothetical protein
MLFRKRGPVSGKNINVAREAVPIAAQCFSRVGLIEDIPWTEIEVREPATPFLPFTSAIALGFELRCKDVSANLSLSEPRSPKLFYYLVFAAQILIYSAFPLTVFFGNRDVALANVLFALVGHSVVVVGMMVLVWTIDHATEEICVTFPPIKKAAAFASEESPQARYIYTSLRNLFISRTRRSNRFGKYISLKRWTIIGESSAVVVAVGFIFVCIWDCAS